MRTKALWGMACLRGREALCDRLEAAADAHPNLVAHDVRPSLGIIRVWSTRAAQRCFAQAITLQAITVQAMTTHTIHI